MVTYEFVYEYTSVVWIHWKLQLDSWYGVQKESDSLDQYVDFLEEKKYCINHNCMVIKVLFH